MKNAIHFDPGTAAHPPAEFADLVRAYATSRELPSPAWLTRLNQEAQVRRRAAT